MKANQFSNVPSPEEKKTIQKKDSNVQCFLCTNLILCKVENNWKAHVKLSYYGHTESEWEKDFLCVTQYVYVQ